MAKRREYSRVVYCTSPGCKEFGRYVYDTRKDYDAAVKANRPYTCLRHGSRMLSPTNLKAEWVSDPSGPSKKYPELKGRWFGNGFASVHAEDMRAEAVDFPDGTRIKITMEVILPSDPKPVPETKDCPHQNVQSFTDICLDCGRNINF